MGDIYYNNNFEAIGVVFDVNPDNIKEAKIISLESGSGKKSGIFNGDFATPDLDDGEVNTARYIEENTNASLRNTAIKVLAAGICRLSMKWRPSTGIGLKSVNRWLLPEVLLYR